MNRAFRRGQQARSRRRKGSPIAKAWPYCLCCRKPVEVFRVVAHKNRRDVILVARCHGRQQAVVLPMRKLWRGEIHASIAFRDPKAGVSIAEAPVLDGLDIPESPPPQAG